MPNVHAAHFSTDLWGDPSEFRPERFLTEDGNVDSKMENFVIPFGGGKFNKKGVKLVLVLRWYDSKYFILANYFPGKRMCVGKNLADANLFLYFTSLMRHYTFSKVPGTRDPSVVPIPGMTSTPQPFDVQIKRRFTMKKWCYMVAIIFFDGNIPVSLNKSALQ